MLEDVEYIMNEVRKAGYQSHGIQKAAIKEIEKYMKSHSKDAQLDIVEQVLMYNNLANGIQNLLDGQTAKAKTKETYPNLSATGMTGSNEDAFRHTLWSYLVAQNTGKEFATLITKAHEYYTFTNFLTNRGLLETKMDLHNNQLGIDNAKYASLESVEESSKKVKALIDAGKTWRIENGQLVRTTPYEK